MTTTAAGTVTKSFALLCPATCARETAVHGSSTNGPALDRQRVAVVNSSSRRQVGATRRMPRGAVFAPAVAQHDQGAAVVCGPASRGRGVAGAAAAAWSRLAAAGRARMTRTGAA